MNEPIQGILDVIGGLAEMAHHFYAAMLQAGATTGEAERGMEAFISAFWLDAMNNARGEDDENAGEE